MSTEAPLRASRYAMMDSICFSHMKAKSPSDRLRKLVQADRQSSPWSLSHRFRLLAWEVARVLLFKPTPKPLYKWRLFILRCFGAHIEGSPFVAGSAIIKIPWHLIIETGACLAPHCEIYNLGHVTIRKNGVVAQHAYLCGGTHDFSSAAMELIVGDIEVGEDAFIGAKAFILPGVCIGPRAIVGACAVVTKDVEAGTIVAGNPARIIGHRKD